MAYEPRGHVKAIVEGMQAQASDMQWTTEEIAGLAGIDKKAVPSTVRIAVRNEVLFAQRAGRGTVYSLTAFEQEPEEEVEPVPFNAALYLDGDLVVYGAQANEDGSFTLTAAQLGTLKKLIAWSPAA